MSDPQQFLQEVVDGRYRLVRHIGQGGYADVYEAREEVQGQFVSRVAVKILTPDADGAADVQALLDEVRPLATFVHEHIIAYRASGVVQDGPLEGRVYLATELGETSLADRLQEPTPLANEELLAVAEGIAAALEYVHRKGAVHRDVKPANVLRVERIWKLADFGLAQPASRTTTGAHGTPYYLAPEVLEGKSGPPVDVYALAVTLLECLTGQFPYSGATPEEYFQNLRTQAPTIPPDLPAPWDEIVPRCLSRDPAQRFTAAELLRRLRRDEREDEPPSEPAGPSYVVAADGSGDFTSVAAALQDCSPESLIRIRPGVYREPLAIDRPVTLLADGRRDRVAIEVADAHAVEIRSMGVVLRGLRIVGRASSPDGCGYVIDVGPGGSVQLEECEVTSEGWAGLAIHGADAVARCRRTRFAGSQDAGVFAYAGGRVTLVECDVRQHARSGIAVGADSVVEAEKCRITDNRGSGVYAFETGRAALDDCEIQRNGNMGVAADDESSIDLQACRVRRNGLHAIFCRRREQVAAERCDVSGNPYGEWQVGLPDAVATS